MGQSLHSGMLVIYGEVAGLGFIEGHHEGNVGEHFGIEGGNKISV